MNKLISTILVITFSLSNIAFAAEQNSFKLSPPSRFSGMKGAEFRDAAQIRLGVIAALRKVVNIDADSLRALGHVSFGENSVFTQPRVTGTILFYNLWECGFNFEGIDIDEDNYMVKVLIRDTAYYCLISGEGYGSNPSVSVVSERLVEEALKSGAIRFTHESIDANDTVAINKYTEHEVSEYGDRAIDEWIRIRMELGQYAVHTLSRKNTVLYRNAQKHLRAGMPGYMNIAKDIELLLKDVGVAPDNNISIMNGLLLRSLVLIPYKNTEDLPIIDIDGHKVRVTAHSSQFATYIFMPEALYRKAIDPKEVWYEDVSEYIEKKLIHEIGAMCGLDVMVLGDETRNLLDSIIDSRKAWDGPYYPTNELKGLAPVNMLDLSLRRDYAVGELNNEIHKKFGYDNIRELVKKIKDLEIEIYVPSAYLISNTTGEFRRTVEAVFGDRLTVYQDVEDLPGLIKDPSRAIVMTVDLKEADVASLEAMKSAITGTRFMNFEELKDIRNMTEVQYHNYIAEVLAMLMVARTITAEEAKDKSSTSYRMLAHLLEDHLTDAAELENYITTIVNDSMDAITKLRYLIKTILKAMPIAVYNVMKPSVEILWSA